MCVLAVVQGQRSIFFHSDVSEEYKTLFKRFFTDSFAFTQHVDRDFFSPQWKKYRDSAQYAAGRYS